MLPEAFSSARITAKSNGFFESLVAIILKSAEEELAGSLRVSEKAQLVQESRPVLQKHFSEPRHIYLSLAHT